MTDKDAGEAARRIEKAFTAGGAYSGDDPVTVARAYLAQAKRVEELESALIAMLEPYAPLVDGELSSRQLYRVQQARAALKGE